MWLKIYNYHCLSVCLTKSITISISQSDPLLSRPSLSFDLSIRPNLPFALASSSSSSSSYGEVLTLVKIERSLLVAKRLGELEGGKTLYGKLYLLISGPFRRIEGKNDGSAQFSLLKKGQNEFPPKSAFLAKKAWKITTFYVKLAPRSQKARLFM